MDLGLKDKVVVVTAASSGLGFATANQLAHEGAKVVICSRSEDKVASAVERIVKESGNSNVKGFVVDLHDKQQIELLIEESIKHFGVLDGLVTNCGGPAPGVFEDLTLEQWHSAIDDVLLSARHAIYAALPHLKKQPNPAILAVTSFSAKQPVPLLTLSNTLRPAVLGMVKTLANELGQYNVRVNSILPGAFATERLQEMFGTVADKNGTTIEAEEANYVKTIPLQRTGDPKEFGRLATFLLSQAASYITGNMIQVDGGRYQGLL